MKNNLEKKRTLTPQQVEEVFGIPIGSLANILHSRVNVTRLAGR